MGRRLPLVDRLRVRTPCDVGWSNMSEVGGRDRHCARCDLTVHDVASMTRAEVETLLEARERGERVCLHLHVRKSDGAVLVADGHVERARRPPPSRVVAAAVATAVTACSIQAPPPEAPTSVIAVGAATPTPIETRPPEPPPIAPSSPPPLATATAPEMPEPSPPPKVDHAKKVAAPPAKKTPSKKHYDLLDGDAW